MSGNGSPTPDHIGMKRLLQPAAETRRRTPLLAAAAAISLVLVGLVSTGAQADQRRAAPAPRPSIAWGECTDAVLLAHRAQCGFLTVPMDRANPDGSTVRLAVSRIMHTTTDPARYQGVMLVNPGGPGGSGYELSVLGSYLPAGTGDGFDWIGFDPRGVGASRPALSCDKSYLGYNRPPYVPTTAAREQRWLTRARGYAHACATAGGALLGHLRTADTVADMESIREALGVDKINYYGFSYGTYIGQVYATLHPDRVRRMVLDGVVDPRRVWYASNLDQDVAFEHNMGIYFGWVARNDAVYHLGRTGRDVQRRFDEQIAALTRAPAGGVIGPDELTDVFLQAGYYVFGWEDIAGAFSAWVRQHDPARLKALYDQDNPKADGDNGYAIYLATQCTDARWPAAWSTWRQDNWAVYRVAPFETWSNAWYNAPCRDWAGAPGTPAPVDGRSAPPILLVNETLDAATPYSGAIEVRKRFPHSALIEGVGGTTHAGSLFGDDCEDSTIAAYLTTGVLPNRVKANRSDKQCAPLPQPNPSGGGTGRAARSDAVRKMIESGIR